MPGIRNICFPDTLVFENLSIGGQSYDWDMGDGRKFSATNKNPFQHFYKAPGIYTVWLKAIDPGTCKVRDSISVRITVDRAEGTVSDDVTICENTSTTLAATGGSTYVWTSDDGSFQATGPSVVVSPLVKTKYKVLITDTNSPCTMSDDVIVDVIPLIVPEFEYTHTGECVPVPSVTVRNTTVGLLPGDLLTFDFGDGFTSDEPVAEHTYPEDGIYTVKLTAVRDFCVSEKSETIPVFRLRAPNVITPKEKDGINDTFRIMFGAAGDDTPMDFGFKVSLVIYNRWGKKVYESNDYRNNWTGDGIERGIYFFEVDVEGYTSCKSWVEVIK
jgi:PKD repeat protein